MAITQIADLAHARQQAANQAMATTPLPPAELPELTQEFITWYEQENGKLVNSNYAQINKHIKVASRKAQRHTRRAVNRLLYKGIAFEDIEPLIKEGIFIYTLEQILPSTVQGTAKPIQTAEQYMLDFYYSVNLVKA